MTDNHEWIVWNEFKGGAGVASIIETKRNKHGRAARLAEPYTNKVGWFDLDELERRGRVAVSGFVVLSPEQWELDRERLHEKLSKTKFTSFPASSPDEAEHRRVLNLPSSRGPLYRVEIERAFRIAAKTSHPDGGGTDEQFRGVCQTRDALLSRALD